MKRAVALIGACAVIAGCATSTTAKRVAPHLWEVTDGNCCNPEKGLMKTCPSAGEAIARIDEIPDQAASINVYCVPKAGK